MSAIEVCRTAKLGGTVVRCDDCQYTQIQYCSCRNRHCPKCQGSAARDWLAEREAELLPVPYHHVVFTLPAPIARIAWHNKRQWMARFIAFPSRVTDRHLRGPGDAAILEREGRSHPADPRPGRPLAIGANHRRQWPQEFPAGRTRYGRRPFDRRLAGERTARHRRRLCLAATIHELTGHAVAVAFNAGNLESAARAFREADPDLAILVAGDNDHRKARECLPDGRRKANTGKEAAEKAANAVGGLALLPRFGEGDRGTDWNDLAAKGSRAFFEQWDETMQNAEKHLELRKGNGRVR
jgi:hypothetical protein